MTVLEGQALLDHGKQIARRYARRIGPDAADELTAEAILRALASPPPDGRMEPWLERIYRNLFVDLWRRGRARAADGVEADSLRADGTPEDDVLQAERRRLVRTSLGQLPRDARRALLSKYYREERDEVAAARLGVAAVTMRTRIHRALARLRSRVGELRGCFPALFGRAGAQLAAVGVAPAMVAALVVAASVSAAPLPQVAPPVVAQAASARVRIAPSLPEKMPASDPPLSTSARTRSSKHVVVVAEPAPVGLDAARPWVVEHVQSPDGVTVFADPDPPAPPCMVEAPTSFMERVSDMVEEAF